MNIEYHIRDNFNFRPFELKDLLSKSAIFYGHHIFKHLNDKINENRDKRAVTRIPRSRHEIDRFIKEISTIEDGEGSPPRYYVGNNHFFYLFRPDEISNLRIAEYLVTPQPLLDNNKRNSWLIGKGWTEVDLAMTHDSQPESKNIQINANSIWENKVTPHIEAMIRERGGLKKAYDYIFALSLYLPGRKKFPKYSLPHPHGSKEIGSINQLNGLEIDLLLEGLLVVSRDDARDKLIIHLPGIAFAHQLAKHMAKSYPFQDTSDLKTYNISYKVENFPFSSMARE